MSDTLSSFTNILTKCREIYIAKTTDYGTAWRILRPIALADQLYIKANRIRTIQENGETKVGDGVEGEFMAIVNYCIMGLIQIGDVIEVSYPANDLYSSEDSSIPAGSAANKFVVLSINSAFDKDSPPTTSLACRSVHI